jgi:hypothetical protein
MPCREEGAATRVAEEWVELHGGGRVAGKVAGGEEKTRGGGEEEKGKKDGRGPGIWVPHVRFHIATK